MARFLRMIAFSRDWLDADEGLDDAQIEAAAASATVGSFVTRFRENAQELLRSGRVAQHDVKARERIVRAAAEGSEHIALVNLDQGVLGQAHIGAGDQGIQLSRAVFATASTEADVQRAAHVAAHERAHGEQVPLEGTLTVQGKTIDHLLLFEGDSEIAGNEATGMALGEHREGQPEKVYREGQDIVLGIMRAVGKDRMRRVLRGSGDLSDLQAALAM